MKEAKASRTAEYMALFRAIELTLPPGRRLFEDRFAAAFLSPTLRLVASLSRFRLAGAFVRAYIDHQWPGARTSAVARTKFIDDAVEAALSLGIVQVVILGAGFDARAYRIPGIERAAVFEVDHPFTSAKKRRVVEEALGSLPHHVRYVPLDFNSDSLSMMMSSTDYDPSLRTLFIWEGVTNYLTEAAVDGTLRWCATAAVGSTVLFTFIDRQVLVSPETFEGAAKVFATLSAVEERWTFGLDPSRLSTYLDARGFMLDKDVGASDYRAICFGASANCMQGYEFYRIAIAHIAGSTPGVQQAVQKDAPGIQTKATTKDILSAVRESRERFAERNIED
jgi:methyltransferase (TIGR00027 family)